jgi:hypothetical protein
VITIRIPVVCPRCRAESLQCFDVASLASALLRQSPVSLRVLCHELRWYASPFEVEQIREYLQERGLMTLTAEEPRISAGWDAL